MSTTRKRQSKPMTDSDVKVLRALLKASAVADAARGGFVHATALQCDSKNRSGFLLKLTRRGYAEQTNVLSGHEYRITDAGRNYLLMHDAWKAINARPKPLTPAQKHVLLSLDPTGAFGTPSDSKIHNGTLASLIRRGYVMWDGGEFESVWELSRGRFALTTLGIASRQEIESK